MRCELDGCDELIGQTVPGFDKLCLKHGLQALAMIMAFHELTLDYYDGDQKVMDAAMKKGENPSFTSEEATERANEIFRRMCGKRP